MATGPGKYDDLATLCRKRADAACVIVIVMGGTKGDGFSVQTIDPAIALRLPRLLRIVADEIEASQAP